MRALLADEPLPAIDSAAHFRFPHSSKYKRYAKVAALPDVSGEQLVLPQKP
jgi:hypothetical protein